MNQKPHTAVLCPLTGELLLVVKQQTSTSFIAFQISPRRKKKVSFGGRDKGSELTIDKSLPYQKKNVAQI